MNGRREATEGDPIAIEKVEPGSPHRKWVKMTADVRSRIRRRKQYAIGVGR